MKFYDAASNLLHNYYTMAVVLAERLHADSVGI